MLSSRIRALSFPFLRKSLQHEPCNPQMKSCNYWISNKYPRHNIASNGLENAPQFIATLHCESRVA